MIAFETEPAARPRPARAPAGLPHAALGRLCSCFEQSINMKVDLLRNQYRALDQGDLAAFVAARFEDDARALRESRARLRAMSGHEGVGPEARLRDLLQWAGTSSIHPVLYQQELRAVIELFDERPPPTSGLAELGSRIRASIRNPSS